jgi:hypothetical protein
MGTRATGSRGGDYLLMTTAQTLRDILSLARLLRRFAEERTCDNHHDLFMTTAAALEDRAHSMANAEEAPAWNLARDPALHAPVNCCV